MVSDCETIQFVDLYRHCIQIRCLFDALKMSEDFKLNSIRTKVANQFPFDHSFIQLEATNQSQTTEILIKSIWIRWCNWRRFCPWLWASFRPWIKLTWALSRFALHLHKNLILVIACDGSVQFWFASPRRVRASPLLLSMECLILAEAKLRCDLNLT